MPRQKLPILHRSGTLTLERASEGENASYRFSISSEAEIERFFGIEVLSHDPSAIDTTYLKRGMAVMAQDRLTHGYHDGTQVGIFEDHEVKAKKLTGTVRFSRSAKAQEIASDVEDGIRKQVSVGYRVLKAKVERGKAGKPDRWVATRWQPFEVTILPLAADVSVGPSRAPESEADQYPVEIEKVAGVPGEEGERAMPPKETGTQTPPAPAGTRSPDGGGQQSDPPAPASPTPPTQPAQPTARAAVADPPPPAPRRSRDEETSEIVRMCAENGLSARASDWIREGLTPEQVGYRILQERRTQGRGTPSAEELGFSERELRGYSYARALNNLCLGRVDEGLEGEVHRELRRNLPQNYEYRGGVLLPMRVRALDAATAGAGAELVGEDNQELITILRNRARVLSLGARMLTGLTGPVPFPKQTGALTIYWVGENPAADVADSDIATGNITLAPKTMQGSTAVSRQLLAQASIDVETMIRTDLGAGHALAIDLAAIHGSGAAGEPQGIYHAPDVLVEAMGGVPTFEKLVSMGGKVADANADMGALAYLTTPLMAAKLKTTPEVAAVFTKFIWTGNFQDGEIAGYKAAATNQVSKTLGAGSDHGLVFGNWNDVMIGLWQAMEVIVDPYSKKKRGLVELTSFQMGDVLLRRGVSFCKATGATIS
jgi:HK97 family phage major capsid protein